MLMTVRLKRVEVISLAIWLSLIGTVVGLLFGIVFGSFAFAGFGLRYGLIYILRWVFLTPVVFGIIGFLGAVISVAIYNCLVRNKGGVVLEFQDIKADVEPPPPPPEFRK